MEMKEQTNIISLNINLTTGLCNGGRCAFSEVATNLLNILLSSTESSSWTPSTTNKISNQWYISENIKNEKNLEASVYQITHIGQ
jgi:hypothetical protein